MRRHVLDGGSHHERRRVHVHVRRARQPNGVERATGGITYLIDAENRVVQKKTGSTVNYSFLYAGGPYPVAQLNAAGAVLSTFHYATGRNVPDAMVNGGVTYKIITDHLGSVRLVVNASTSAIVQRWDYDAWGNATLVTGSATFQPFGFAGGIYDPDTKLVRFGARDYNARLARWMTKDGSRFNGGINFYAYANGDPVNFVDRNGYQVVEAGVAVEVGGAEVAGWIASTALGAWLIDHLPDLSGTLAKPEPSGGGFCPSGTESTTDDDEDDKKCDAQYVSDLATYRSFGRSKRKRGAAARCYESALNRYNQCKAGLPQEPLAGVVVKT